MARPRKIWTIEVLEQFISEYATTPNHVLAKRYNVSVSFVRRKAKELHLIKDELFKYCSQTCFMVQELYGEVSYKEIAKRTGVCPKTVERIARRLEMRLKRENKLRIMSIAVRNGLRSERRRRLFGLDNYYNRPVGTDKERRKAARALRRYGYIVVKGSMTAYYNDTMDRYEDIEEDAIANGFKIVLWK